MRHMARLLAFYALTLLAILDPHPGPAYLLAGLLLVLTWRPDEEKR